MPPARALGAALLLATANTAYLTWRYLAVRHGWSAPGAGLCSWTAWVDCDRVLQSAEARWFFVPHAVLGLGFFGGCWLFWRGARATAAATRLLALQWLAHALALGALASLWFPLYLMTRLDALCPLCPWNHALAFAAAWAARRTATAAVNAHGAADAPPRARSRTDRCWPASPRARSPGASPPSRHGGSVRVGECGGRGSPSPRHQNAGPKSQAPTQACAAGLRLIRRPDSMCSVRPTANAHALLQANDAAGCLRTPEPLPQCH
ncbi:MAG: vitamin K epoxide reductase family protein [Planctomycetota bacterium]